MERQPFISRDKSKASSSGSKHADTMFLYGLGDKKPTDRAEPVTEIQSESSDSNYVRQILQCKKTFKETEKTIKQNWALMLTRLSPSESWELTLKYMDTRYYGKDFFKKFKPDKNSSLQEANNYVESYREIDSKIKATLGTQYQSDDAYNRLATVHYSNEQLKNFKVRAYPKTQGVW